MPTLKTSLIFSLLLSLLACNPKADNHTTLAECDQPRPVDTIALTDLPKGIPLYRTMFADSIRAAVASGRLSDGYAYHNYLQSGHFATVRAATEEPLLWGLDSLDEAAAKALADYRLKDARQIILDRAANHQLTFITEAHTKPEHRVYVRSLLKGLYEIGYRHLGLENVMPLPQDKGGRLFDSTLQQRGYPLITPMSGLMSSEPEYANLIREAIAVGYEIFSYERNGSSASERDLQQAERLIAYQQQHPGDKVICYGGWYHNIETPISKRGNNYWMAYHYKSLTADDPLTIYQDALNEKISTVQQSSPYYLEIVNKHTFSSRWPQVLVGDDGQLWQGPKGQLPFDITLVYPPLNVQNGYGEWQEWYRDMYAGQDINTNDAAFIQQELSYPVLVEVRKCNESELATPIFSRELSSAEQNGSVFLPRGTYRLDYLDQTGGRGSRLVGH